MAVSFLEALWWLADLIGLALTFILPSNLALYREYHLTLPHVLLGPLLYFLVTFLVGKKLHWYLWRLSEATLVGFLVWNVIVFIYVKFFYQPGAEAQEEDDEDSDDE